MTQLAATAPAAPHWDLSNVYPGLDSPELAAAQRDLQAQVAALEAYLDAQGLAQGAAGPADPAAAVGGYLERLNALTRLFNTLGSYSAAFITTDSYNDRAKRLYSELQLLGVRLQQQEVRFAGWLGAQAAHLPALLAGDARAQAHAFFLRETAEQSRYLMSAPEEALAAELAVSGQQAWNKLHGTLCAQLTLPFTRHGVEAQLPLSAVQNLYHDPDPEIRRRAYETEIAGLAGLREPLTACLNGVKGAAVTLAQRRGRPSVLAQALDDNRIDQPTLDALLGAMTDAFPVFRRYLKKKAERLGRPALPFWDLQAPVSAAERTYTWPEAEAFIIAQFGTFSGRLADFARHAFAGRWVDAEPRAGKRGGAFCMDVPGVDESRVLMNFDGSFDSVSTLAHELGHAFHNACQVGKTSLQTITPMTLAETASIFCETIITQAALAEAGAAREALAILETDLIGKTAVVVDISSRFLFEREVIDRRAQAELSADDFCEIMLRAQAATYGDGLAAEHRHPYMWAWKPHYYSANFYNFPYAFGLLFGTGLYALYQQRGAAFVPDYEALLAGTGEASAADLAARFGIDLRQRAFWAAGLQVIADQVERYCAL